MAISDREFYASHGLHIDQEKMLEDYVNKKIIEVLTDLNKNWATHSRDFSHELAAKTER